MGPPGNRVSWGPCVLAYTQTTPKKAYERYQGHLMGPPTDPGPSGSARVSKWSVRPCIWLPCPVIQPRWCKSTHTVLPDRLIG
ncbi:unnamed protein product [Staurois parvus]|uniref:Uncharacterized protein n=1 Tax=Staurois parvus TaxID=386267 RepID=A0ABN9HMQ1_9NEOB|nr:unnamed protein product [Staurois parvus]